MTNQNITQCDCHPVKVLFSGTQIKDINTENGLGKTTNLQFTVILGATLHKEGIEKEWYKSRENALDFKQQAKDSLSKFGW